MSAKLTKLLSRLFLRIQIFFLWIPTALSFLFRKKLDVRSVLFSDPVITSEVATLIWKGKRCYKIVIDNSIVVAGSKRVIPIVLPTAADYLEVKFLGVSSEVIKKVPIRRRFLKCLLPNPDATLIPKLAEFNLSFSHLQLSLEKSLQLQLPEVRVSLPEYVHVKQTL